MEYMFFTSKELYDILVEKLQPDDDDYTKIFQLVGDYTYKREGKLGRWIGMESKDRNNKITYHLPELRTVVKNVDISAYVQANILNDDQRILLSLLGITFVEKGQSFLMFSDPNLKANYEHASNKWFRDRFYMCNARGTFHLECRESVPRMFQQLISLFNVDTVLNLQRKFYLEREREKVRSSYNALCAELPENTLIAESLPVLVLYQIVQENTRS